jgi:hypothetical protein
MNSRREIPKFRMLVGQLKSVMDRGIVSPGSIAMISLAPNSQGSSIPTGSRFRRVSRDIPEPEVQGRCWQEWLRLEPRSSCWGCDGQL